MSFTGKKVLITGASRGIGREMTKALVDQGATVAIVGRYRETLEETRSLTKSPTNVHICPGDLRKVEQVEKIVSTAISSLGEIDILMNIAGVWHDSDRKFHGPIVPETRPEEINDVLGVGLVGH